MHLSFSVLEPGTGYQSTPPSLPSPSPLFKPQGLYFSKALLEGLIFGGAHIRRGLSTGEIYVSKSIGLA